jgi:hypothetical protein
MSSVNATANGRISTATACCRPAELWAALRRRLFPDGIAKRAGFRSGHDVRPGFRGRVAVFALTGQGRRRHTR